MKIFVLTKEEENELVKERIWGQTTTNRLLVYNNIHVLDQRRAVTSALDGEQTVPRVVPMLLAATLRGVEMSRELSVRGGIEGKS